LFWDEEIEVVLIVSSPQASSDSARVTDLSAFGGRAPTGFFLSQTCQDPVEWR